MGWVMINIYKYLKYSSSNPSMNDFYFFLKQLADDKNINFISIIDGQIVVND